MASVDELLQAMSEPDYLLDKIQFVIDENLRTIAIPSDGVVLGVHGDKDVNRVNFKMPKMYNGFDMSEFSVRINYLNANGDVNYYDVEDLTIVDDDTLAFTWLVDEYVCAYVGQVTFIVYMFKVNGDEIIQKFHSTIARATVLVGLEVDEYIDQEAAYDILTTLRLELEKVRDDVISDIQQAAGGGSSAVVTQLSQDVESLKTSVVKTVNGVPPVNGNVNISAGDVSPDDIQNSVNNYLAAHPVSNVDSVARAAIEEVSTSLRSKVNTEAGKGLSSNDYTNDDKAKVDNIPDDPKYTDTIYDDAGKANRYTMKNVNVAASNWQGSDSIFTNEIQITGVTSLSDVQVLPSSSMNYDQGLAWCAAMILTATQSADKIMLKAFGEKPAIDIPITVLIGSDVEV